MTKLKTILQSNSSKFIHLTILISLFLFIREASWLIILLTSYLFYLYKKIKSVFLIGFLMLILISIRIYVLNLVEKENLPIIAEINEVYDHYIIVKTKHKYLIYIDDTDQFKPGMVIKVKGRYIERDTYNIIHNFNYKDYLKSQKIIGLIKAEEITHLDKSFNLRIIRYSFDKYLEAEHPKTSSYLKMFLIGSKEDLNNEIYEKSNKIGISHLFAISGMHLALIVGFLNQILKLFYLRKSTYNISITVFLLGYIVITGFTISIIRAALLIGSILYAKKHNIVVSNSDLMTFSFLLLLLYNPYYIFNIGFQFSYLIAFTLILNKSLLKHKQHFIQIFIIGFLANLVSLPIILEMNKEVGIMNVFINVIFVMLVAYLLLPGAFIVLLLPESTIIYSKLINTFEYLIEYFYQLNYYISFNFTNSFIKLGYWLLLMFVIILIYRKKRYIYVGLLFVYMVFFGHFNYFPELSFVRILDVNQGDAIHVHEDNCDLLIDTGNQDEHNHLLHYLKGSNIRDLDAIIITHGHIDHYGEINVIIDEINVSKIYVNKNSEKINNSNQIVLQEGDLIECGKIEFTVLNAHNNSSNENNNSIVLYGQIGLEYWLFTGDIEEEIEEKIISEYNIKVDQLKVSHHGSNSSSSQLFLETIMPKDAYISVGHNSYEMPDIRTLNRFSNLNINLNTTYSNGSITVYYYQNWRFKEFYFHKKYLILI